MSYASLTRANLKNLGASVRSSNPSSVDIARLNALFARSHNHPFTRFLVDMCGWWADNAFSVIEPGSRLAASLCATKTSMAAVENVRTPWPCYGVHIPRGVVDNEDGFVLVVAGLSGVTLYGTVGEVPVVQSRPSLAHFVEDTMDVDTTWESLRRLVEMIGRLVVNLCVEIDNVGGLVKDGEGRSEKTRRVTSSVYRVNRPVQIDARSAVMSYVRGEGRAGPSVRTLVRGHWKMQPHGVNRQERRRVHIEPYWRGPEDGPVTARPHVIGD